MTGFKNEDEMWAYQRKHFIGKWDRYELIRPSGHPDVKGSYLMQLYYIENKVGTPSYTGLEESQKLYLEWLVNCGQRVYICFGSESKKSLLFARLEPDFLLFRDIKLELPPFYMGA